MTASGELAECICCLGAGRDSQRSSDSHTFEPGGSGRGSGGSLAGDFGGSCLHAKVTLTCGRGWGAAEAAGARLRVGWRSGVFCPPREQRADGTGP